MPGREITRTGTLLPFRRGFERIMKGRSAPIIPVHLDRVWASIFSFNKERFLWKFAEKIPYPVTVSFGASLPSDTPAHEVRNAIRVLGESAWHLRKAQRQPLHRQFIRALRRRPLVSQLAVYLCGSGGMIADVTKALQQKGLCPIYREKYYDAAAGAKE